MVGRLWFIVPRAPLCAVPLLAAHINVKWRVLRALLATVPLRILHPLPSSSSDLLSSTPTRASICQLRCPFVVSCYYFFRRLCPARSYKTQSAYCYRAANCIKAQWLVCLSGWRSYFETGHCVTVETETANIIKLFLLICSSIILVFLNQSFRRTKSSSRMSVYKSFKYRLNLPRENFCSFFDYQL